MSAELSVPIYYVETSDPLMEPEDFPTYEEAVARAKEIEAEIEAEGYTVERGLASRDNCYASRGLKAGHKPYTIEVTVGDYTLNDY